MSKPEAEAAPMAALVVASLSRSFHQVPPSAVPATLDCILATTGLPPLSLFASFLDDFPNLLKGIMLEDENLDSDKHLHLLSLSSALCHLLKKMGADYGAMKSFMYRCFLPLVVVLQTSQHDLLSQITEWFMDVVVETGAWGVFEEALVPNFLKSVGLSMGMLHSGDLDFYEWSSKPSFQGSYDVIIDPLKDKELLLSSSSTFTLKTACNVLSLVMEGALQCAQTHTFFKSAGEERCIAIKFVETLIWDLCNMTERMLLHSLDHRSCAVGFFLPIVHKAFPTNHKFEISIRGQRHDFSREHFFIKLWNCCITLFSGGKLERRDAYNVLSLCFSFLLPVEKCEDADSIFRTEEFDIRAEKQFWDEIKTGLVDKENLVRKQSLHILKMALNVQRGANSISKISKNNTNVEHSAPHVVTKRERWAYKEAKSLGVGKLLTSDDLIFDSKQFWDAFVLLYEMLEEYGTHLVEAAWNNQVSLLLQFSGSYHNASSCIGDVHRDQLEICGETFNWLPILWERGLHHGNPQVRCLIMQSFLDINWEDYGNYINSVPEDFVLGPFMQGLNDPIHHKEFGIKGVFMSRVIEGAARFIHHYVTFLIPRKRIAFLCNLASTAKHHSFGRAGLMALAECIALAAAGIGTTVEASTKSSKHIVPMDFVSGVANQTDKKELLDIFRYVVESSKQHFNPSYRLKVCSKILEAAVLVVCTFDIPLEILLLFLSAFPREFTDYGGQLRATIKRWLSGCGEKACCGNCCSNEIKLWESLCDFPLSFVSNHLSSASLNYDDEDLNAWEFEANRWARVLLLAIKKEHPFEPILTFLESSGADILNQGQDTKYVKFLILALSLVLELHKAKERAVEYGNKARTDVANAFSGIVDGLSLIEGVSKKLVDKFLYLLDDLVQVANQASSIFWSGIVTEDSNLPGAVKGKLGGPSQRRLSISTTTAVLQAVISVKALSLILLWCKQIRSDAPLNSAFIFIWQFFWRSTRSPCSCSETQAEIHLAAYEALVFGLKVLASPCFLGSMYLIKENENILSDTEGRPWLDSMCGAFFQNINDLLRTGVLARTRRAVLLDIKWVCLESLLSIPSQAFRNGFHLEENRASFSEGTLECIFSDLVESLENAGESSVLPMLRSLRMLIELVSNVRSNAVVSISNIIDTESIWNLVRSSWILHISCNKRRISSIAALLSSVLHPVFFNDEIMHQIGNAPGPLKWFVQNLLEEGKKSPRTIRLAALHLTGLWLLNPRIIKFYLKELKLLSLYGSVAFDEDFEAELADNNDARLEVSLLARSPDQELTEAFINTELYARVSVAVLFYKLADQARMVGSPSEDADCIAALESGKSFLLELLDFAVNDKDLAKELYKKYSAIHRRKIRVWQIICVLSPFVDEDIVGKVVDYLYISLHRNNLPAVRQYLETFAINIYLKFPFLVQEKLVLILRDYDMRPQALSSYVFIAANVILNSSKDVQSRHLDTLFPLLVPLLTSHHHSLRGFTQLLAYQILHKLFPLLDSGSSEILALEKRCLVDLKTYLAKNSDCARLRTSMAGYLDAYNPNSSATPAGIFVNRVEEGDFECVPTSLMEQVLNFLNDAREDLRCSMAKDVVTIRNETLNFNGDKNQLEHLSDAIKGNQLKYIASDFQKKVTVTKHDKGQIEAGFLYGNDETYRKMTELERDDLLLDNLLQSRRSSLNRLTESRQHFIFVASLLDRIPNLAGLARTCEVFRASGLAVADANIISDKQFQLISVTAEKWVPIIEVPVDSIKAYLQKKKREGFSILGLEQTANSIPLDKYSFPKNTVLVLGREKEGIPVDIIHILDACVEIPQFGVIRSLNVHVSGAIALWEYTRQQRSQ